MSTSRGNTGQSSRRHAFHSVTDTASAHCHVVCAAAMQLRATWNDHRNCVGELRGACIGIPTSVVCWTSQLRFLAHHIYSKARSHAAICPYIRRAIVLRALEESAAWWDILAVTSVRERGNGGPRLRGYARRSIHSLTTGLAQAGPSKEHEWRPRVSPR